MFFLVLIIHVKFHSLFYLQVYYLNQGKTENEIYAQIIKKVDVTKFLEARDRDALDFEETERGAMIIWAFTKNADKDTPEYDEWFESFDYILPVGEIIIALFESWHKSAMPTVEIKN